MGHCCLGILELVLLSSRHIGVGTDCCCRVLNSELEPNKGVDRRVPVAQSTSPFVVVLVVVVRVVVETRSR